MKMFNKFLMLAMFSQMHAPLELTKEVSDRGGSTYIRDTDTGHQVAKISVKFVDYQGKTPGPMQKAFRLPGEPGNIHFVFSEMDDASKILEYLNCVLKNRDSFIWLSQSKTVTFRFEVKDTESLKMLMNGYRKFFQRITDDSFTIFFNHLEDNNQLIRLAALVANYVTPSAAAAVSSAAGSADATG